MSVPISSLARRVVRRHGLADARARVEAALAAIRLQAAYTEAEKDVLVFRWLRLDYVARSLNRMPDNG